MEVKQKFPLSELLAVDKIIYNNWFCKFRNKGIPIYLDRYPDKKAGGSMQKQFKDGKLRSITWMDEKSDNYGHLYVTTNWF